MKVEEIDKLAKLARIELSEKEKKELLKDIEEILGFVNQIREVSTGTEDVESRVGALRNVMREDTEPHEAGKFTDALLKGAPAVEKNYIKVKKIL